MDRDLEWEICESISNFSRVRNIPFFTLGNGINSFLPRSYGLNARNCRWKNDSYFQKTVNCIHSLAAKKKSYNKKCINLFNVQMFVKKQKQRSINVFKI